MLVRSFVLLLFVSACHARDALRDVSLAATLASAPQARDIAGTVALVVRPTPPPLSGRDDALNEPGVPPSRLPRCRSRHGLCEFEASAIAHALASIGRSLP